MTLSGPWHSPDEEINDWQSYIRNNSTRHAGHDVPYPGSNWSYASGDSTFAEDKPSTWKRSDETVHDEVADAYYHSADVDASDIEIHVLNGTVTLIGTVDSSYAKLEATRLATLQEGVWDVHNDLVVSVESKRSLIA